MRFNSIHRLILFSILAMGVPGLASSQSTHMKIPLTVTNGSGYSATIYFGIDPTASYCVDPSLGEFELPPDRCGSSEVCAYFIDSRDSSGSCLGNGVLLDLQSIGFPAQADSYRVVISAQDYPLRIRWPEGLQSHFDSASIAGISGGSVAADMLLTDSLVVTDPHTNQLLIQIWNPTGILDAVPDVRGGIPGSFALYQNYPNPFNPSTSISYDLPSASRVTLRIYNTLGELVATLVDSDEQPGRHRVEWNPAALATGIYYCQLKTPRSAAVRIMALVR